MRRLFPILIALLLSAAFAFGQNPTLTSVTPNSAPQGRTTDLTGVKLVGTFPSANAPFTVFLGGDSGSSTITSTTSTEIDITILLAALTTAQTYQVSVCDTNNNCSGTVPFTVTPPPAITSLSVSTAEAGQSASVTTTLTGTNFPVAPYTPVVVWTLGATTMNLTPTSVTSTSAKVVIPSSLLTTAGTATIAIEDSTIMQTGTEQHFVVNPGPSITSISPNSAIAGQTGFNVTITGTNLPTSNLQINWTNGTTVHPTASGTPTATSITFPVTTAMLATAGTATVSVTDTTTGIGVTSNTASFTIGPAPALTSISPTSAIQGQGNTVQLMITGTNLPTGSIAQVNFTVGGTTTHPTITNDTPTLIIATLPTSDFTTQATATVAVTDTVSNVVSNTENFNILAPPVITTINPISATAGQSSPVTMTITGTNFPTTGAAVNFTLGGNTIQLTPNAGNSATSMTVSIPVSDLGTSAATATIAVNDTIDAVVSATKNFTINAGPTLTSISPTSAIAGQSSPVTLNLTGTNFPASTSQVNWTPTGGTTSHLTPVTFNSSTSLTVTVSSNLLASSGSAAVSVTDTATGATSNSQTFSIGASTVSSVTPNSTTAGVANAVAITVTGTNFTSATKVTFCSPAAGNCGSPTQIATNPPSGSTSITASIPANMLTTAGSYQVGVTNSDGSSAAFTVNPAPSLSGISPTSVAAGQTSPLTLTLSGLNLPTTGSVINWIVGGVSHVLQSIGTPTSTSLMATVPTTLLSTAGSATVDVVDSNGVASNMETFTVAGAGLSSISPNSTTAGEASPITITVNGSNFANSSVVTWCNNCGGNPTVLNSQTFVSASKLTASIPASLVTTAGTAQVGVDSGSGTGSTLPFTINPKPALGTLSPTSATAGQSQFNLTLSGTNLPTASTIVNWLANGVTTPLSIVSATASQIVASVPASLVAGAGAAAVSVSDAITGVSSGSLAFNIAQAAISAITPLSATAGSTNPVTLTVTGSGFVNGSSVVTFCNACNGMPTMLATTVTSPTTMTATIPANLLSSAGLSTIGVMTGTVTSPSTATFTVGQGPALTSLSQTSASAGQAGFTLTLTGTNFATTSPIVNWVFNGQTTPLTISANSSTSITATVLATLLTTPGTAAISVSDSSSGVSSNSLSFTISAPTVSSLTPNAATAGTSSAVPVTVNGANFLSGSTVTWCNACGTAYTPLATRYVNGAQLTATIPSNLLSAAGTSQVGVINTSGATPTGTQNFTIGSGPMLTSVAPSSAVALQPGAVSLNLTGSNLPTANAQVNWTFSGVTSSLVVSNDTASLITATIPASFLTVAGTATVSVTDTSIGVTTNTENFIINPAPNLSAISPSFSFINPSTDLTLSLSGTNFPTNSPIVNFTLNSHTVQLAVSSGNSATAITATVPKGLLTSVGTATVTVTDPVSQATSNSASFTLTTSPQITTLSPTSVPVGSSTFTVTLTGSAFLQSDNLVWTPSSGSPFTISAPTVGTGGSSISFNVPAADVVTPGPVSIQIQDTANSVSSNLVNTFTINTPAVTSVLPAAVPAGSAATTITVNGSNFVNTSTVTFCAASGCTPTQLQTTFVNSGQLTATIPTNLLTSPSNTIQIGVVTVILAGNVTATNPQPFIVTGPAITSISPNSVASGSGLATISVFGSNFVASSIVTLCNSCGTNPTPLSTVFVSSTQLTATIPANMTNSAATYQIGVSTGSVSATNPQTFSVGGPTVTSISPSGTTAGVTTAPTITVNGSNYVNGTSVVTWCNSCGNTPTNLTTTFVTSTQLTAVIPVNLLTTPGSSQVGVSNAGVSAPTTQTFTIGNVGLTTVSPTSAAAGSPGVLITLTGSNFLSTSTIIFTLGSTPVTITPSSVTSTQIQALIPAGNLTAAGSATISVQVGSSVSSPVSFTINSPTITSITPAKSATGVGAFPITIAGTNFLSGSIVQWTSNGTTTPLSTSFQDANDLVAIVNTAQVTTAGTALVSVLNTGGAVSPGFIFTVGASPTLTTLTPSTATAGSGATQIALQGTNFQNGSIVTWNNSGTVTNLATGFVDGQDLTATVPATLLAATGSALVAVQNPGAVNSNSQTFTIAAGTTPSITPPLVPSSATVGGAPFQLMVMGSNFVPGSIIQWNNGTTTTALTTSYTSSQLSALVPATLIATAGTAFVSVLNPGGGTSAAIPFAISATNPTISSTGGLAPSSATVGSASFQLAVTGTNFVSGSVVQWNAGASAQALQTVFNSSTSLTAIVPATDLAATGTVLVSVSNPGGAVSNSAVFSVSPAGAPVISLSGGLAPSTAVVGTGAFVITVNGSNFFSGSIVQWGTGATPTALSTSYISGTQLSAVVPATLIAAAGSAFITVLNPGGLTSNTATFTIGTAPGPTISTLTPSTSAAGGAAFQLAVTGANFATGSVVQWNGGSGNTALATQVLSSTQLSALVPATLIATPGTAFVGVMNTGGATSNLQPYTITAGASPTINSTGGLSQSTATVGSAAIQITVNGSNFTSTSVVQWSNGATPTNLSTVYLDPNTLSAIVPASLLSTAGTAFVTVSNGSGNVSNAVSFTVAVQGAPTISTSNGLLQNNSTTGNTAPAGSPAIQLIVVGTNFVSGSVVYWNNGNNQALTTSFVNSMQLTAVVPASLLATAGVAFVSVQNPGPVNSNSVPFTIGASTSLPTLTTLLPSFAAAGGATFQLSVTGTNFANGSVVTWNSNGTAQNLTTGFGNSTSLTALVPATLIASPGIALITVVNPDKTTSNSTTFSIGGSVPVLTQLTPATAAAGTQGLLLVATGTGFASGSSILWGTTPLPTSFNSATQLTATVGTAQLMTAGTTNVTVQSPGGASNGLSFVVTGPAITLLSPAVVTAGAPAFVLSVGGNNFVSGSVVTFGGTALTTTYVSATQLTAQVPATAIATASSVTVTVSNPGGAVSAAFGFSVGAVPAIQTIAPTSASPGSAAFTLQVTGSNFANGDTVQWNGVNLTTMYSSATSLSAMVPATLLTSSGSVNVSVLHAGGVASNAVQFTINSATLTSIAPTSAPAGSALLQLTVNGTSFVNGSIVQWNGAAVPTTYVSATQLSASISNSLLANVGTAFVAVQNPGGSTTTGTTFSIAGPTLTTIAPTSITAGAASLSLTLTGTNFVTNSVATWNGAMLPTSVSSATSATAQLSTAQLASAGTFVVVMTNPGGSTSGSQLFTVNAPVAPTVSGLTPTSGIAGGPAFQLTVAGSGFVSGATVQWNGTAVATSYVGPTQLTALINSTQIATPGTANVTIQIPGAPISATTPFAINPPAITTLNPTTVAAGGPAFNLVVTGGNFLQGSTVQWNGTTLATIFNSATQLTANVPANLITSGGTASITVSNGATAVSAPSTFTIGPFTLAISTATLPDSIVNTNYSQVLSATGGSPPYVWTVTAGALPAGLTLDPASGTVAGIATAAATGTIGFTVTDSVARTVTKSIAFRSVAPLTITTATPLANAPAGTPFSQILAVSGGTAPFTFSLTGSLPPGLTLNTNTGQISGTPTVPGSYNFTINVADSRTQTISVPFGHTITATGVTIGGIATTSTSGQQLPISVTISNPYPVTLTGTLTMVFTSAVGASDPAIQFSTGGLNVNFTIAAGTTQAVFGTQQSVLLITGTTAGSIVVTAALQANGAVVTPATAPSVTTTIAKAPPVIGSVTLTTSGTNTLNVAVTGYSNTRDMTSGNFQFLAAPNTTLTAAPVVVNLAATFSAWYQSAASLNFGSNFTFSVPISFTGSLNAIGSVSVTLVNSAGTSAAVTATRQ